MSIKLRNKPPYELSILRLEGGVLVVAQTTVTRDRHRANLTQLLEEPAVIAVHSNWNGSKESHGTTNVAKRFDTLPEGAKDVLRRCIHFPEGVGQQAMNIINGMQKLTNNDQQPSYIRC